MLIPNNNFIHKEFDKILKEQFELQGWTMPEELANYIISILIEKIDKNPWQPQPSYAEAFMNTTTPAALIKLGDTCWFTRAVFPDMFLHRGLTANYWVELGTTCYTRALKHIQNTTIEQIEKHFEFIAEMTHTAIHHHGKFRSMWDSDS